jgi:hypothetical protein
MIESALPLRPAQATALAVLVDLEACWENLRKVPVVNENPQASSRDLAGRQRAYDAFRTHLLAYNATYTPAHVPDLLLNSPARLGSWCGTMRNLFRQIEANPGAPCPHHLLAKAYRRADHLGSRLNRTPVARAAPPATVRDAVRELEALTQWCLGLEANNHTPSQPGVGDPGAVEAPHPQARERLQSPDPAVRDLDCCAAQSPQPRESL